MGLSKMPLKIIHVEDDYFGLKHPCLWCSRADHVLDRGKKVNSIWVNSVCHYHASEIAELGYCQIHRKLAKSQEMCENCSSRIAVPEETTSSCSCCNQILEEKVFRSDLLLRPSWCDTQVPSHEVESNDAKKWDSSLGTEDHTDEGAADVEDEHQIISDLDGFSIREVTSEEECSKSFLNFRWGEKESIEDAQEASHSHGIEAVRESRGSNSLVGICLVDSSIEVINLQCLGDKDTNCSSDILNLIDLIDSSMNENQKFSKIREEEQHLEVSQEDIAEELYENNSEPETKKEPDELPSAPEETAEISEVKDASQTLNLETEAEEEKFPKTPTSLECTRNWKKKLLMSERRDSSMEDSLDGSVLSEIMDGMDAAATIERLKSALTSERKALRALYAELEEERSASAIAANHTMAMITRLQEEKAVMQMEALQYQRMMEEQSEYDQEALQLLNELMMKREKEKQQLEEELQVYREKFSEYEAKEGLIDESPAHDSGDDDEMLIDLNRQLGEDDINTTSDEIVNLEELAVDCMNNMNELDDSLAEFEEERLSILNQLKSLEDKLLMMSGDGESLFHLHSMEKEEEEEEEERVSFPEDGSMRIMAKKLLPLLDAAEGDGPEEKACMGDLVAPQEDSEEGEREAKRVNIVEEVDRVYERLQALEEDQEFLNHCMNSMKKGDEGMNLLREILQHLRDLKNVELRERDIQDQ
ncbi:hypothetical protein SAY86_000739 [Trapa natans]|uniref:GTD-binding domain-containing protein n=1 Tax=Trapa natans TaxID=22666 RepID=A0AAN7MZB1_TRANT|nr:hypothetical protein SAY86_000739 [Trapa natans]